MLRTALPCFAALILVACPATNSRPCSDDTECFADQRCRRGACGPLCLDDSECGSAQVCTKGTCQRRPECGGDTDCATGFACDGGACQCTADTACAANQVCLQGACATKPKCASNADCAAAGERCEITQGVCHPVCASAAECAPDLDPRVAFTLYGCIQGTCTRHCTGDIQCGATGYVCRAGLCAFADCKTAAECPAGQYCTSATTGRCQAYTVCTTSQECARNSTCVKFAPAACPPGFDCTQAICQELPRCLADGDCVTGFPGAPTTAQVGYCAEGHCQASAACVTDASCATGQACIARLCVPSACRGLGDCPGQDLCASGACRAPVQPVELVQLGLVPEVALLEVGETLQFSMLGSLLDGSSVPVASGTFTVVDGAGQPSTAATVSANGLLTAVAPGVLEVRFTATGGSATPASATVRVLPRVGSARRVVVTSTASHLPLPGVTVRACATATCPTPVDVTTDATGIAEFPTLAAGPCHFTAIAPDLRTDGRPFYERATALAYPGDDLLLPLRENPVHGAAGFNASLSFSEVSTSGTYWAGLVIPSFDDLAQVTPQSLVGDTFMTDLPGLNQAVPVPSGLVLYTSPAFGVPQEIKGRSLGVGQAGTRAAVAFAGRLELDQVLALRSTDVLGYLGSFDFTVVRRAPLDVYPWVPDTTDINGNGRCSSTTKCPMGTEDVPDYGHFAQLALRPNQPQALRTEVIFPRVPSTFDTVITSVLQIDPTSGALPLGFTSRAAGASGQDGTRPVDTVVVRSGPPSKGLEVGVPAVLAIAGSANGTATSARLSRSATLPRQVRVMPFLPAPANDSYSLLKRAFQPGQPAWASAYSTGAEVARVGLSGTQQRHAVYFAMASAQVEIALPPSPPGPGADPLQEAQPALDVVVIDLPSWMTTADAWDLPRTNLSTWLLAADGFARDTK